MTAFDIFFFVIVGLSGLYGISRGLVMEVLSVGAWVAAIIALKFLFTPVSEWMRQSIGSDAGGDLAALVLIILVTVALVRLIGMSLSRRVKGSALAPIDRLGGGGFGVLRGLIVICFIYMFLGLFLDRHQLPNWIGEAKTHGVVETSSDALSNFIGWVRNDHSHAGDYDFSAGVIDPDAPLLEDDGYTDQQRRELNELFQKSSDSEVKI
ncbi:CvpA family protein [Pedomonas mirosovicensis]|uniref:CvpA family protein n=1 Tax=Pedomonas mirosovicensis TaxID=2908641 RepID=UPI00216739BA|nr:CvpA family protein [Pedomonas mirosovicensis]MCH8684945.1 CvpA family protein [Pedomonas mirosovicensis]